MDTEAHLVESHEMVRKKFSRKLGLNLTDKQISELLTDNSLSIEQLMENHTLTEIGTALIRLDTISMTKQCPNGGIYIWPFGCVRKPTWGGHQEDKLKFQAPPKWLK